MSKVMTANCAHCGAELPPDPRGGVRYQNVMRMRNGIPTGEKWCETCYMEQEQGKTPAQFEKKTKWMHERPAMDGNLNEIELAELSTQEAIIMAGLQTFVEVGSALLAIREKRLYRQSYGTFDDYCRGRWGMSKTHANRLIDATEVMGNLTPIGVILPTTESQIRPLAALPPEEQSAVWQEAIDTAPNGKVTAAHVERVVEARREQKMPETSVPSKPEATAQSDSMAVHYSSETAEHYTPRHIIELVIECLDEIDLDPCSNSKETPNVPAAKHYTAEDNGLGQTWRGGLNKLIPLEVLHRAQLLIDSLATSQDFCRDCLATTNASACKRRVGNSNLSFGALESQIGQHGIKDLNTLSLGDNPTPLDALVVLSRLLTTNNTNAERIMQEIYRRLVDHFDLDFQSVIGRAFLPGRGLSDALVDVYTAFSIEQTGTVSQDFGGNRCVYHGLIIPELSGFIKDCQAANQFRVYLNPPYGRQIGDWIDKLCAEYDAGNVTEAIALVPARVDTQWWKRLNQFHPFVCFVEGRLSFVGNEANAPFPSALIYLGANFERFYYTFCEIGEIYQRVNQEMFGA